MIRGSWSQLGVFIVKVSVLGWKREWLSGWSACVPAQEPEFRSLAATEKPGTDEGVELGDR